jgi:hypothetical protein
MIRRRITFELVFTAVIIVVYFGLGWWAADTLASLSR